MAIGIFSPYRAGENRVTSSLLAVLRSLSIDRMQRIVGAMLGEASTELVKINNQVAQAEPVEDEDGRVEMRRFHSVPDGEFRASFRLLLETKTRGEGVDSGQLIDHLDRLDKTDEAHKLIVLTPDTITPPKVVALTQPGQVGEGRIVWSSFADLNAVIDEVLDDPEEVVGEREAFLLRELQAMFEADGLLGEPENVVVVAARSAWPFYLKYSAYTCPPPPRYSFRQVGYMAFYHDGHIQPQVAKIIHPHPADAYEEVDVRRAASSSPDDWLKNKCQEVIAGRPDWFGDRAVSQFFRLSPPKELGDQEGAELTIQLDHAIKNDTKSAAGRGIAFTYGKRYVRLDRLQDKKAKTTSDVVGND